MKKTFVSLLILVAAFTMVSPAFAEVRGGAFTISPFVGGYTFDGNQHIKTNIASGLRLGYNLTQNWGVEGQFTYVPLHQTWVGKGFPSGDQYSLRGDVMYHFIPESRFVPFLVLGGGWTTTDSVFSNNDDATLDYGGGVKIALNDWLDLRGDIRHIFSFHTSNLGASDYWQNLEYTVGLSFQFGGVHAVTPVVKKPMPEVKAPAPAPQAVKPAPAPAPVPVKEESTVWLAKKEAPVMWEGKIEVTGIALRANTLEIVTSDSFTYQASTLSQPSMLVIDIPDGVNSLGVNSVEVNQLGISTIRIGSQKGFVRVILDAAGEKLLPYRVEETGTGLKIIMTNTGK